MIILLSCSIRNPSSAVLTADSGLKISVDLLPLALVVGWFSLAGVLLLDSVRPESCFLFCNPEVDPEPPFELVPDGRFWPVMFPVRSGCLTSEVAVFSEI